MEPVFTMEEIIFFNNLLIYLKQNEPATLALMLDSGITEVADTLSQITSGDR